MANLVTLVPVRNGREYLQLFLSEAASFSDFVVALNDGSTDDTGEILKAHQLVRHVISNPRRETYHGWDDLGNRNSLLQLLTDHDYSGWVLFLDADEILDAQDAQLLTQLIENGSLDKQCAYGFRVYRMVNDLEHFCLEPLQVYRLFYASPGCSIAGGRLHFIPVPQHIHESNYRPTNLRIKHRSSMTAEKRQERYQKYIEADPDRKWQPSYDNLVSEPKIVRLWSETNFVNVLG